MRHILYLFIFTINIAFAQSGHAPCGSAPTPQELTFIKEGLQKFSSASIVSERSVTTIPIKIWVFDDTTENSIISDQEIQMVIQDANEAFALVHLKYAMCDSISHLVDDVFTHFSRSQESALKQSYYTHNVLNFYLFHSLTNTDGSTLCGYARYPGAADLIAMDKNCLMDGSTFIHELGHFWGLYHTHGNTNQYLTPELVNGNNCAVAGDDVCDTPADPNLRPYVFEDCVYNAQILDNNGDLFTPDPFNYMCYAHSICRSHFTDGQIQRMEYVHEYLRTNLQCASHPANMSLFTTADLCDTSAVVIYDYLGNITGATVRWDLNANGYFDYTGATYEVVYDQPGNYDILMEVEKDGEINSFYQKNAFQLFETEHLPFQMLIAPNESNYKIENPDHDDTWFIARLNANEPSYALTIDNYHNYQRTEKDALILPPVMLDGQTVAYLKFDIAYAWHGVNYDDQLDIDISLDCGMSFSNIYRAAGSDLATVPYTSDLQWMPIDSSEWRYESIDLSNYLGSEVIIKFTNTNDFGNQLYLDNILIDGDVQLAHRSLSLIGRKKNDRHNLLKWKITDYFSIEKLWLEASLDGYAFEKIMDIDFENKPEGQYDHQYDKERDYYYRIAGFESGSELIYSRVEFIPGVSKGVITIYPNPTNQDVMISMKTEPDIPASYLGHIMNHNGQEVGGFSGVLVEKFGTIPVTASDLPAGIYYLEVKIGEEMFHERFVKY